MFSAFSPLTVSTPNTHKITKILLKHLKITKNFGTIYIYIYIYPYNILTDQNTQTR